MKRREFIKMSSIGASLCLAPGIFFSCKRNDRYSEEQKDLFELFQNPPSDARPFVRWWWNGNRVNEEEILRELDILKKAGIGGVEINPVEMPGDAKINGEKPLTWLSPEWNKMVKAAAEGAHDRDMIADMIVGTGWPFGGRFLPREEQIKGVVLQEFKVKGPTTFNHQLSDIVERKRKVKNEEKVPAPELLFLRLVPVKVNKVEEVEDVTDQINDEGEINIEIPAGDYILYMGTIQTGLGFKKVMLGAPGADGPCLDHYNSDAVKRYINRVSNNLGPELGGKLGNYLRALFVDSIELSGSDWTGDLKAQFMQRRGYDITPYYQFVFYEDPYQGYENTLDAGSDLTEIIKRVRFDYSRTLVELFLERFTETYHKWCHRENALSRYQAYGTPWLMGMSEGYMIPDIPESNNWLFSPDPYAHGYYVWNKYTSAGAHLSGKMKASCEAMTNTRGVFKTTLEMLKRADDMNFIMGLNHDVLHGFNYSPPEAGFPGWVRFGTYFSEQNTWWPYFYYWVDYNARLSAVFQHSKPVMDVAILTPRADIWSNTGLAREPLQTEPWYGPRLWEPLNQNGLNADYISESVIQMARIKDGYLRSGYVSYHTLILTGVQSLLPETVKAIQLFAEQGGNVIFIDKKPHRSPSLSKAKTNDEFVNNNIQKIIKKYPQKVHFVSAPESQTALHNWIKNLLLKFNIEPAVMISKPDPDLYQMKKVNRDKEIYFFVNNSHDRELKFEAKFKTGNKTPFRWDPSTGEKSIFPYSQSKNLLNIKLEPLESLLIVYENKAGDLSHGAEKSITKTIKEIKRPWKCTFNTVDQNSFDQNMNRLQDLSKSSDARLQNFAGTINYQTTFNIEEDLPQKITLGKVNGVTEVELNGEHLGVEWWGKRVFDISGAVKKGQNELKIKVTTVLYNYVQSMEHNKTAQNWVRSQSDQSKVQTGLLGPVELIS